MAAGHDYSAGDLAVPAALRPFAELHLKGPRPLVRIAELLAMPKMVEPLAPADVVACAAALRRAAPEDRLVWALTAKVLETQVPSWHWNIVADATRNAVYDKAARALIKPGMTVLEIGTGTGILSMMAARAGADHVYTVEINPCLAHIARTCIAQNGYADRITVIEGDAMALQVGGIMPRRAHAMIHEITSTDLISQSIVPLIAHARDALLEPGALLLPEFIWTDGALVTPQHTPVASPETTAGFDLTALDILQASARYVKGLGEDDYLSVPARLAEIDLNSVPADHARSSTVTVTASRAGDAGGVAQWPSFSFPDGTVFDGSLPGSCWGQLYHRFDTPRAVAPGETIDLQIDLLPRKLAIGLGKPLPGA